jgi:hypothetical protein
MCAILISHNQAVTGWLYQNDAKNYLFMLNCIQYKGNYIIFIHVHNFDIYYILYVSPEKF